MTETYSVCRCLNALSSTDILQASLPCHFKTTHKSAKFETLKPLCLLFHTGMRKDFIKMDSSESRCVERPENILSAGASLHLSAWKFYRLGQ